MGGDEETSRNPLFKDLIYIRCLELARQSDCQRSKYGCVLTHNGEIIVESFNHKIGPLKNWCKPDCVRNCLDLPSRADPTLCCCGHAEELAVADIANKRINLNQTQLHVAGIKSDGKPDILEERCFSCILCARQIYFHGGEKIRIFVPVVNKWRSLTAKEALESAMDYQRKLTEKPKDP